MIICSQCHYRYYNDDLRLDCCKAKQAPISNPVTGERYCETINKDGNCGFFRPDKRFLVRGMMFAGILFICAILAWPLWNWAKDNRAEIAYIADIKESKIRQEKEMERIANIQRAEKPLRIYRGTYNGKPIELKVYDPIRD